MGNSKTNKNVLNVRPGSIRSEKPFFGKSNSSSKKQSKIGRSYPKSYNFENNDNTFAQPLYEVKIKH